MNNNFEAINYYRNQLNELGEINETNQEQCRAIFKIIDILFDRDMEEEVSFVSGPHNSTIKDKYESDIAHLEVVLNPVVKEIQENETSINDIEIEPIVPIAIDTEIVNNMSDDLTMENDQVVEEIESTINDDEIKSIVPVDANKEVLNNIYTDITEETDTEKNKEVDDENTDKEIDLNPIDPIITDDNLDENIDYIPGTKVPKPRERGIYESTDEYVEYLKNHYDKYSEYFNKPEQPKSFDTIPEGQRIMIRPVSDIVAPEQKPKKRWKVTNVFKPVKEWARKFKKLVWPTVKETFKKLIVPVVLATSIATGAGIMLKKDLENMNNIKNNTSYEESTPKEQGYQLGQQVTLNDGTPIYRNSDFTGQYGTIGNDSSKYNDETNFSINAINLIDSNTNEEKQFNLVEKNQEQKKQIIKDYYDYINNNEYNTKSIHVTPVIEEGKWVDENGLGAWLNPDSTYIDSYENETERRMV